MKTNIQFSLTFIIAFFAMSIGFAQNPIQGEPSQELEERAAQTAEEWTRELALSPEQTELMEDTYIEYGIKKRGVIQSDLSKEQKDNRILELQRLQYSEMRNILTKAQFDRYKALLEDQDSVYEEFE